MKINTEYNNQHQPSSSEIMEGIQGIIYDMLIEPMQKKLNLDDITLLGKVGEALEDVAQKATAYEHLNKTSLDKNYRN